MDTETFALIVGGGPVGLAAAIELAWRSVPTILVTGCCEPPDGLYRSRLVLIRPDHHIAWHGDGVADAAAVIDRLREA